jgi:hypothetical protein
MKEFRYYLLEQIVNRYYDRPFESQKFLSYFVEPKLSKARNELEALERIGFLESADVFGKSYLKVTEYGMSKYVKMFIDEKELIK